jgi:hypothetical protein
MVTNNYTCNTLSGKVNFMKNARYGVVGLKHSSLFRKIEFLLHKKFKKVLLLI